MFVSSYQIHNVLNVYSRQLSQDSGTQKLKAGNKKQRSDQIHLSTEGKRRATLEKVAQDILRKISEYGVTDPVENKAQSLPEDQEKNRCETDKTQETAFRYNIVDELNKKTTTALPIKDTNFLINRLEQLAKDAGEKDSAD